MLGVGRWAFSAPNARSKAAQLLNISTFVQGFGSQLSALNYQQSTSPVLFVTDLFHPVDRLAVQRFLNGDMRHRGRWGSAMPMLLTGRKPNHIAWPNFLDRTALTLRPPKAGRDDQRLTEWMRMPGSARTGLERDAGATNACWVRRLE